MFFYIAVLKIQTPENFSGRKLRFLAIKVYGIHSMDCLGEPKKSFTHTYKLTCQVNHQI